LDLAGLTLQTFMRACSRYGGGAWSAQVVKLLEDTLGTDPRARVSGGAGRVAAARRCRPDCDPAHTRIVEWW
jgi:hypothetical protein